MIPPKNTPSATTLDEDGDRADWTPLKKSPRENETKVPIYRQRRFVAILLLVGVTATSLIVTNYTFHFFNTGTVGCGSSMPVSTRFTVFIDYVYRNPIPTINVTQGETITIHAWNNSTFTHQFSLQHYFDQGTVLQPGQSCDLTFSVSQSGAFRFYSNSPDPTINLAQLNVNPTP